jgi:hypothetical protein
MVDMFRIMDGMVDPPDTNNSYFRYPAKLGIGIVIAKDANVKGHAG